MTVLFVKNALKIRLLSPDDIERVLAAAILFDEDPKREWSERFLRQEGHHLLMAYLGEVAVGFVSGIELVHPDKAPEMLLYELGVDESSRRRGIGRRLVLCLKDLALERHCRGMWVPIEPDNEAALATYRSAGADAPEAATIMAWDF